MEKENLVMLEYDKIENKPNVRKINDDDFETYKINLIKQRWNYFSVKTTPIGQSRPLKKFHNSNLTTVEKPESSSSAIGIYDSNDVDHLTNMVNDVKKFSEQRNFSKYQL